MPTILTPELLKGYFKDGKRGAIYEQCISLEKGLRIHVDGIMPEDIIGRQRPSEPKIVMDYRKQIWQAITKETVSRVITCLSKIRRSQDWSVRYDEKTFSAKIAKNETPKEYFEKKFPYFSSLTNWLFSVCLKEYLIDANAVCVVMPLDFTPMDPTEYLQPYPYIFNSGQVYDYVVNDYAVIRSKDTATYMTDDGKAKRTDGAIFWVITTTHILRYEQVNEKGDLAIKINYEHSLGYMPAFKLGGMYLKAVDKVPVWESRINSIVPRLNKAAREDNDLDISVVRNLFLEKWEYVSQECNKCNGLGKVNGSSGFTTCEACNGQGKIVSSPMQVHAIKPASLNEQPLPTPPAGYIEKPVEIIRIAEERIEKHLYKALAAINMEFLAKTPMNESGLAKQVDKDELNNFVYSIAEDIVFIIDNVYKAGYDYRYKVVVPIDSERYAMLPVVNVPEKYDMLSTDYLVSEYNNAVTAKLPSTIINKMAEEIASKKFSTDPEVSAEVACILRLDPFAGMSSDDKMAAIQNKFITNEDAVISANIQQFVRRAKEENDNFYGLDISSQREVMEKMADEKIAEMDEAAKLKAKMFAFAGVANPNGDPNKKEGAAA
ncbi:MAG TPA: hypothetical protein PKV24_20725 [Cyclobacteriaceae bacterium]|nr:hypothetical protein [Cyclobacteriaceae bacterium]